NRRAKPSAQTDRRPGQGIVHGRPSQVDAKRPYFTRPWTAFRFPKRLDRESVNPRFAPRGGRTEAESRTLGIRQIHFISLRRGSQRKVQASGWRAGKLVLAPPGAHPGFVAPSNRLYA